MNFISLLLLLCSTINPSLSHSPVPVHTPPCKSAFTHVLDTLLELYNNIITTSWHAHLVALLWDTTCQESSMASSLRQLYFGIVIGLFVKCHTQFFKCKYLCRFSYYFEKRQSKRQTSLQYFTVRQRILSF